MGSSTILLLFIALYLTIQCSTNNELITPDILTNLIVDNSTGNVYIGGKNFILKANADLVELKKNTTGPLMDNPECLPRPSSCAKKLVLTANTNKVLVIHESKRELVTCGSFSFGTCEIRNMDTLEEIEGTDAAFVASNLPSPAVGIISKGPKDADVFYIATSWGTKTLGSIPPEIATRTLDYRYAFDLETDKGKESKLTFKDKKYNVSYVYGFANGGFTYFISVQETYNSYMIRKGQSNSLPLYETKISHLCQKDDAYFTYTEIPLKCTSKNGTDFNIARSASVGKPGEKLAKTLGITTDSNVVFVTFSPSKQGSKEPLQESVLCYYSVVEIEAAIKKNVQKCFKGGIPLGMPWVNDDKNLLCSLAKYPGTCYSTTNTNNYPIGGSISLSKKAVMEGDNLISVAVLPYEDNTAVFLGDANGNLLKVSIGDDTLTKPYFKKSLTGGKAIKKLVISKDKQSLYIGTSNKVMKVPVEECSSYSDCQSCTGNGDPFCGWCSLYTKCSRRILCPNFSGHPLRFTTNVSKCIQFASMQPERVPYGSVTELKATIQSLPPVAPGMTYKCKFGKQESQTTVFDNGTVHCTTPSSGLPPITSDTGDVQVELSLFSTETRRSIVSTKVPFYDCTKMKSCVACAESNYDCDWCTYKGKCFADGSANCPGEVVLSKNKRLGNAVGCPYLEENQKIYIANGISSPLAIKAKNLPLIKYNFKFKCILLVGDAQTPFHAEAVRDSDTKLICNPKVYTYSANTQFSSAQLQVLWRGVDEIQKPKSVTVSLYKCFIKRSDCSTCLTADPVLNCGWCKANTNSCQVKQACPQLWKHRSESCNTVPQINTFSPSTGPPKGGTVVEIDGVDFGKDFADIENTVFIANYSCIPDPKKYEISRKIVCNTTSSGRDVKGPIRVIVNNFEGISKKSFSYQTPKILDFFPKKGPESGGSFVNITGIKLNTGRTIMAWLGNTPCIVDRAKVTDSSIPCVSQPSLQSSRSRRAVSNESSSSSSGDVIVSFDGFRPPSPPVQFEFTADPKPNKVEPDRTFPSGGLIMHVTGRNFESVQVPKMYYTKAGDGMMVSDHETCNVISNTKITCHSPNITKFNLVPGSVNDSKVIVGFIMDNVQGLGNISTLSVVLDPYFKPFDGVKDIDTENPLVLEGSNLELLTKDQVTVTIEGVHCNVTAVADKNVVCTIPSKGTVVENLPEGASPDEFTLTVKAAYLTFVLGKVKYAIIKPVKKVSMLYVYIGVGVGGLVFLVVIFCLVCAYRKKKRQQYKSNERYEMKIANMESKVAKECRKAFAELQTDMTDWTNDLSEARMPFWDFRTYALHVLFPGVQDHAVLNMKSNLTPNWENGLRKFSQLIYNKDFLLNFVRTLEQQNNFNMKDRCNLASLIMVALQSKMEYATDILRQLLCELVRKSVAKSHPKLLLRRTESVAEKLLTNWLAFCMYNHLKEESGKPLFMLFMAIKCNIDKGPVDQLTGDARYSLSENKLLRHTVEYEVLRVSVSQDDDPPIQVTLLDSDTITQAKNKILDTIHKHEPFSSRPKQETFQLSWLTNDGAEKVLMDDDSSSVVEGPWRRLNTLGHYQLPNDALLKLSTHHTHFYGSTGSDLHSHSVPRTAFKPFSYAPLSRGSREDLIEEGGKVWHLVKQVDYTVVQEETKMMPEIYLTRLLATKGILQQFVDDLFDAIFTVNRRNPAPAIKFMFDLLDDQAQDLNLTDPEVLHTWKNNSLPLRFWINIVKNPNFIFDLNKGSTIDSCLSVIAQLFMDACSTSDDPLSEDSPSNKLLYAKDISNYKKRVERYYSEIRSLPPPSEADSRDYFADLSMQFGKMFNADVALRELFRYVLKYQDQLQEKLEESRLSHLASKLELLAAEIADD